MAASFVAKNMTNRNSERDFGSGQDDSEHNDSSPTTFRWDYLDLDQEISCGSDKCLFRSSSRSIDTTSESETTGSSSSSSSSNYHESKQQHPNCGGTAQNGYYQTGYLVAKDSKYDESILDGWKISQYLQKRFGIKHFFLEPPIQVQLEKSRFEELNSTKNQQAFLKRLSSMGDGGTTTVQKINIAPKSSREMRYGHSEDNILKNLEELLDGVRAEQGTSEIYNSSSKSSSHEVIVAAQGCGFFLRLEQEITKTIELLRCEPLMALDFQFILDTSGNLYHLDFDRVITNQGGLTRYNQTKFDSKVRSRLEGSLDMLQVIRRWIQTKQQQVVGVNGNENENSNSNSAFAIREISTSLLPGEICKGDWEAEETAILASNNLPCLAMERVAIDRHKQNVRMRHPLLVAMFRRVIEAGFYDEKYTRYWDCNAFGDRVVP